jgi:hypothetical protein
MKLHQRRASWRAATRVALCLLLAAGIEAANAASLTQKDVQILVKAIGFLEPPPSGNGTVAIAFEPSNPASKADADAIAGYFGDGLKAGAATLKAVVTPVGSLSGGGFVAVVAAAGVKAEQVSTATAVQAGQCVMSVKSDPKVEILISRSAAASSNVGFGSAFLLMAHEI